VERSGNGAYIACISERQEGFKYMKVTTDSGAGALSMKGGSIKEILPK
jgi:hypothetical protein